MEKKTPTEQIEDLLRLKEKGAITDEEFARAKGKLLEAIGLGSGKDASVSEALGGAAASVTQAFSNSLNDSDVSFKNLAWILYWGTVAMNIIGLFPVFLWVSLIMMVGIVVISAMKMAPSSGTIYNSHFRNIVVVSVVSVVGYFLLFLVTLGTLGLGLIITVPLFIALLIWYVYRIVKGMMRLNERKEI